MTKAELTKESGEMTVFSGCDGSCNEKLALLGV